MISPYLASALKIRYLFCGDVAANRLKRAALLGNGDHADPEEGRFAGQPDYSFFQYACHAWRNRVPMPIHPAGGWFCAAICK
jgi:hypothetical protein